MPPFPRQDCYPTSKASDRRGFLRRNWLLLLETYQSRPVDQTERISVEMPMPTGVWLAFLERVMSRNRRIRMYVQGEGSSILGHP